MILKKWNLAGFYRYKRLLQLVFIHLALLIETLAAQQRSDQNSFYLIIMIFFKVAYNKQKIQNCTKLVCKICIQPFSFYIVIVMAVFFNNGPFLSW